MGFERDYGETGGNVTKGGKELPTGETINKLPESITKLYNRDGNPEFVDTQIVEDLLSSGKYTEQPVSVEEGQKEKEVKDVITAHIYSYLQKQKDVYATKNPNSAREVR